MGDKLNLPHAQRKVLVFLAERWNEDFGYLPFEPISRNTGLDVRLVRRACRALTRKGLAEFARGLWREDGGPGGSGYAATESGRAVLEREG